MSDREEVEKMNMVNMRLAFNAEGTAVYKSVMPTGPPPLPTAETYQPDISLFQHHHEQEHHQLQQAANSVALSRGSGEPAKRRRGRPRKYASDGSNGSSLGVNLTSPSPSAMAMATSSSNSYKKARGRPPGSSRKQLSAAFGTAGAGFMPHVITVQAGEDLLAKIMSFSQNGPRAVCILSANGAISSVTLRQATSSGGTVTYEGRFEILSLSGSILLSEIGGQQSRTGGLSVSLAGPDGRVLGGGVAGLLTAASPVQVIVGSFLAEGWKQTKSVIPMEPLSSMPRFMQAASAVGSPASRGNLSESSGGPGSPLNQITGGCSNSNAPSIPNMWK